MKACTLREVPCGTARRRSAARRCGAARTAGADSWTAVTGAAVVAVTGCTAVAPDVKFARRRLDSGIGFSRRTCVQEEMADICQMKRSSPCSMASFSSLLAYVRFFGLPQNSNRRQGVYVEYRTAWDDERSCKGMLLWVVLRTEPHHHVCRQGLMGQHPTLRPLLHCACACSSCSRSYRRPSCTVWMPSREVLMRA